MTLKQFTDESIKIMIKQCEVVEDSRFNGIEKNNISVIKMEAEDYYKDGYTPQEFIQDLNDQNEDNDLDEIFG